MRRYSDLKHPRDQLSAGDWITVIGATLAVLLIFLAFMAAFPVKVHAHDIYQQWKQPGGFISCCSETDCRALNDNEAKFEQGHWTVWHKETGKWIPVPERTIINEPNPNGKAHLCASPSGMVWCFLRPDGGT